MGVYVGVFMGVSSFVSVITVDAGGRVVTRMSVLCKLCPIGNILITNCNHHVCSVLILCRIPFTKRLYMITGY